MDALDHMLTDPLDSGQGGDGRIMEECMLGNTRVSLPEDLLEDPEIFFSVVSDSTWHHVLTDAQRQRLRQLLPHFPEDSAALQDGVLADLFGNQNFRFGNPLHLAQKLFRDGYFNPEVVKYRQLVAKSQRKRCLYSQQQHYHRLLKQILVSRKELLDRARRGGPDLVLKRRRPSPSARGEERERRARRRVLRILREVKSECGDGGVSSEDDDLGSWLPASLLPPSPSQPVALRVLPSLFTQDMKTADKPELTEKDLRAMLRRHREKRRHQPDRPDLLTSDLSLSDIVSRVSAGRKGSIMALVDLGVPKKKAREEKRKKKMRPVKMEPEDPCDVLGPPDAPPAAAAAATVAVVSPEPPAAPLAGVKEEPVEEVHSSPAQVEEITACFFTLLEDILRLEGQASVATLEERVQQWQASPASTLNPWFSGAPCWSDLVLPALHFLAGESKAGVLCLPAGFSPSVEFQERSQHWKWISPSQDCEKDLNALCQLWLETKDQVVIKPESEEPAELTPPTPRVWTDYVVRPSTGEERQVFQEQEQQRYDQPHRAFTFRMHGFESVVGPVKGVFDKETSLNKAREHSLLRSDRPAYVTILSLVRDAAARLPNGEGTRAEICELLKDSQFLAPDVTSAQVNTVVSGALDRLHYEKDPCVKYDIGRKLWIYLHRDRSQEEFERIHQAQAAAAKAKKALQQKPKPAPKLKASAKEAGLKTPGAGEPGQILGLEPAAVPATSLPPTPTTPSPVLPGTPRSPSLPSSSTPTKSGAGPDTVKPSPSVLLVSPPSMPQLGTLLSASQPASQGPQPPAPPPAARVVAHAGAGALPQVRVVTAQPGLPGSPGAQQAALVHPAQHPLRLPVSVAHTKGLAQVKPGRGVNNRTDRGDGAPQDAVRQQSSAGAGVPRPGWPHRRWTGFCRHSGQAPGGGSPGEPCCLSPRGHHAAAERHRAEHHQAGGDHRAAGHEVPARRRHPADGHQPAHPGQGRAAAAPLLHHHGRQGPDGAAHHAGHDGHPHQVPHGHRQAHARRAERGRGRGQEHLCHAARHALARLLLRRLLLRRLASHQDLQRPHHGRGRRHHPGENAPGDQSRRRHGHPAHARAGRQHGGAEGQEPVGHLLLGLQAGRHHPHHARPGRHPAEARPGHRRRHLRRRRQAHTGRLLGRRHRHHRHRGRGGGQGGDRGLGRDGRAPVPGHGDGHCPPGARQRHRGVQHAAGEAAGSHHRPAVRPESAAQEHGDRAHPEGEHRHQHQRPGPEHHPDHHAGGDQADRGEQARQLRHGAAAPAAAAAGPGRPGPDPDGAGPAAAAAHRRRLAQARLHRRGDICPLPEADARPPVTPAGLPRQGPSGVQVPTRMEQLLRCFLRSAGKKDPLLRICVLPSLDSAMTFLGLCRFAVPGACSISRGSRQPELAA